MPIPNIVNHIQKHRVLISLNDDRSISHGSGTLIKILDRYFVITAQHVIREFQSMPLFVNFGVPYHDSSPMIKRICSNSDLDIAYIELDSQEVERYRGEIEPVVLGELVPSITFCPEYRAVAIIGYPGTKMILDSSNRTYSAGTFHVLSQLIKDDEWPNTSTRDKSKHMLIQYGPKHGQHFIDHNGQQVIDQMNPSGLSGSAIWKFNPTTMNSEMPEYALWGIIIRWNEREEVLIGTYIQPLIDKIKIDYGR